MFSRKARTRREDEGITSKSSNPGLVKNFAVKTSSSPPKASSACSSFFESSPEPLITFSVFVRSANTWSTLSTLAENWVKEEAESNGTGVEVEDGWVVRRDGFVK